MSKKQNQKNRHGPHVSQYKRGTTSKRQETRQETIWIKEPSEQEPRYRDVQPMSKPGEGDVFAAAEERRRHEIAAIDERFANNSYPMSTQRRTYYGYDFLPL